MLGYLICGHGHFGTGMASSIHLIAGQQEQFAAVDFTEGMTATTLITELKTAIKAVDGGQGVVVFTDIPGGTPFNEVAKLSVELEGLAVIAGTNIPLVMTALFQRNESASQLFAKVKDEAQAAIKTFSI